MSSRFAAGDQIMFAYDMVAPKPIGKFRAAVLAERAHVQFQKKHINFLKFFLR